MAFKSAKSSNQNVKQRVGEKKPLVKAWMRLHKDDIAMLTAQYQVDTVRLTSSGEWILLETDVFDCLVSVDTEDGLFFANMIKNLEGLKYALVVIPQRGQLGFDYGVDDAVTVFWVTGADGYLHAYPPEMYVHLQNRPSKPLTLEAFAIPELQVALEDDRKQMEKNARRRTAGGDA
jgi:hypothetical protein